MSSSPTREPRPVPLPWSALRLLRSTSGDVTTYVFTDPTSAARHVNDHLLVRPESEAWGAIEESLNELVDVDDDDRLFEVWRRAQKDLGRSLQPFYDAYARHIIACLSETARTGWIFRTGTDRANGDRFAFAFSTLGVLVVAHEQDARTRAVRTAFIPGEGDRENVVWQREQGDDARRVGGRRAMRSGQRGSRKERASRREIEAATRRRERWTSAELIHKEVFKPALKHVRRATPDLSNPLAPRREWADLKGVLPGRLTFEEWRALRADGEPS